MLLKAMMPLFKMAGKAVARFSIAIFKHLPDWLQLLTGPMMVKFLTKINNVCNLDLVNEKTMRELTDEFKKRGVNDPFELEAPNGIARVMKDSNGKVTMFKEGPDGKWIENGEFDGVRVMKKGEHYQTPDGKWHGYGQAHLEGLRDGPGTSRMDNIKRILGTDDTQEVYNLIDDITDNPDERYFGLKNNEYGIDYEKTVIVYDPNTGKAMDKTFIVSYNKDGNFQTIV